VATITRRRAAGPGRHRLSMLIPSISMLLP
jgi:hypothetical protein